MPGPEAKNQSQEETTPYNYADADLVIATVDGRVFSVHSSIMSLASAFFRTMLSLPKTPATNTAVCANQISKVDVPEKGLVWQTALDVIYPDRLVVPSPGELTHELFEDLCNLAEKYDMPGLHRVLSSPDIWERFPPVFGYVLACNLDWRENARLCSKRSLSVDIMSAESQSYLEKTSTIHALQLVRLHNTRKTQLISALHFEKGDIGWKYLSTMHLNCLAPKISGFARWYTLRHRVQEEMERMPSGDSLRREQFWQGKEFLRLWDFLCPTCNQALCERSRLKNELLTMLDTLPTTV